jgi:hypothetical protein
MHSFDMILEYDEDTSIPEWHNYTYIELRLTIDDR